jgi:DNA helicase-2/ATP-dependent DNA helicase PcrA
MHENNETFSATDDFMNDFSWWMNRNKDSFTREDFKLRMEYGYKILPDYYEQNISKWNKVVVTERKIRNVEIEGVPITGNLDKIEFNGKMVNVVDYKTGKFKNAKPKFNKPSEEEPHGGDYWRQAVFYRILIDNDRTKDWQVVSTEFDFIEPISDGEYHKEKVMILPEDVEIVKNQITSVYSKITSYQFDTGCGKKECEWCHFVRSNFKQTDGVFEQIQAEDADM